MKKMFIYFLLSVLGATVATAATPEFKALVLAESGVHHVEFSKAAIDWLNTFASDKGFEFDVIDTPDKITADYLAGYKLFIQLDYPPFGWNDVARKALEDYLIDGRGGWIGFHHASLLGNFDGFGLWKFFSDFLGDIEYRNYIESTCSGDVLVEKAEHPVMKGVNARFTVADDEWYTYDRSPHPDVNVLATIDEGSYDVDTDVRMGDHPVVWVNERIKARNVYFQMGHSPTLFRNQNFTRMFGNAILWASGQPKWFPRFRALVVHNPAVEPAHRQFDIDAMGRFRDMAVGDGMVFKFTSDFNDFDSDYLRTFDLVISLDDNPGHTPAQREAFERYMEDGGAWLGFHAAGFNNESTDWPWFLQFLGGGQFYRNNWPPLPAKIMIDERHHDLTKGMPDSYIAPANEWYQWKPSPRENPDIKVFASLSADNYPIGFKDEIPGGDTPVVWSNTRYNMVYMNFGHGPHNFTEAAQNYLISNAIRWLVRNKYRPQQ